jgi:hypothetical protein
MLRDLFEALPRNEKLAHLLEAAPGDGTNDGISSLKISSRWSPRFMT